MPPTAIWPSPPTLVRLARFARTKPKPTRANASAAIDRGGNRIGRADGAVDERRQSHPAPTRRSTRSTRDRPGAANATASSEPNSAGARRKALRQLAPRWLDNSHCACPAIMAPIAARARRVGGAGSHDPAAVKHDDAVGDRRAIHRVPTRPTAPRRRVRRPRGSGRRPRPPRRHRGRASAAPRPGTTRLGSVISRASTAFCWLPPESDGERHAGTAGAHVETLHQSRAALRSSAPRLRKPKRVNSSSRLR